MVGRHMAEMLPYLAALKEVVVTLAAATGAFVAVLGLNAWKRQLAGRTEYEVAIKYLRSVYKLRDAIGLVRSPFMSADEMAHAVKEIDGSVGNAGAERAPSDATVAAYTFRWKSIMEAMSDIQVVSQEAEVLWGTQVVELLRPLRQCVSELNWAVDAYLREKTGRSRDRDGKLFEDTHKVVFWMGDDPVMDPFSGKVTTAVSGIERFIRPRLK